jgi:hypothetical protein
MDPYKILKMKNIWHNIQHKIVLHRNFIYKTENLKNDDIPDVILQVSICALIEQMCSQDEIIIKSN